MRGPLGQGARRLSLAPRRAPLKGSSEEGLGRRQRMRIHVGARGSRLSWPSGEKQFRSRVGAPAALVCVCVGGGGLARALAQGRWGRLLPGSGAKLSCPHHPLPRRQGAPSQKNVGMRFPLVTGDPTGSFCPAPSLVPLCQRSPRTGHAKAKPNAAEGRLTMQPHPILRGTSDPPPRAADRLP